MIVVHKHIVQRVILCDGHQKEHVIFSKTYQPFGINYDTPQHTVRKSYIFSSILVFAKKKFPQFFQTEREVRVGLEEYLLNFLDDLAISIQYKNLLNNY